MYFRLEIDPRVLYFTAVVGKDSRSYFLLRDLRKVLSVRQPGRYSPSKLDRALGTDSVDSVERLAFPKNVDPLQAQHFKFRHYRAVSEDALVRVMDTYVRELDPQVSDWFRSIWTERRHVRPVNPAVVVRAVREPFMCGVQGRMPRFVLDWNLNDDGSSTSTDTDGKRRCLFDYLSPFVSATVDYYERLERGNDVSREESYDRRVFQLLGMMFDGGSQQQQREDVEPMDSQDSQMTQSVSQEDDEEEDTRMDLQQQQLRPSSIDLSRPCTSGGTEWTMEPRVIATTAATTSHRRPVEVSAYVLERVKHVGLTLRDFPEYLIASDGERTLEYRLVEAPMPAEASDRSLLLEHQRTQGQEELS